MAGSSVGRGDRMERALRAGFPGADVRVRDESARHAGHAGAQPGGETHYAATVTWDGFAGQSRVARQRRANALVAAEFADGLHALSLDLRTPAEAAPRDGLDMPA